MSMLEKFKNFEVKEEDQISDADKRFLENWEKQYESVIQFYRDVYAQSKEVENNMDPTSIPQYSSLRLENFQDKVLKMVCEIQREYPDHIYSHFRRGYQIEKNPMRTFCWKNIRYLIRLQKSRWKNYLPCRITMLM